MKEEQKPLPNPGSPEAVTQGCTCPVSDNGNGKGSMWGEGTFVYMGGCPVHAPVVEKPVKGDLK